MSKTVNSEITETPLPTSNTKCPVCPWCGAEMKDAYELRDSQETDCGSCLKPIHVFRHIAYTYNTHSVTRKGHHAD